MYYGKEENGKSRKDLIKNKDTGMQLDSKKLLWKHPDHREECGQNFVKSKLGSKLGGPKSKTGEDGRVGGGLVIRRNAGKGAKTVLADAIGDF